MQAILPGNTNMQKHVAAVRAPARRVHIPRRDGLTKAQSSAEAPFQSMQTAGGRGPAPEKPRRNRGFKRQGAAAPQVARAVACSGRPGLAACAPPTARKAPLAAPSSSEPSDWRVGLGPGSSLCPARAALPVPLGPPLARVPCPSPFPEPRGAGAPGGAGS